MAGTAKIWSLSYTRQAREDVLAIWAHIAQNNPHVADQVFDRLEQQVLILKEHSHAGKSRPDIAQDARCLVVERWLVLYRILEDSVQIVRVIDGARDVVRGLWQD